MYNSKSIPEIIEDYKSLNTLLTPNRKYRERLQALAAQLTNFALARRGHSLDLNERYYGYIYLDSRHPAMYEDEYRYVLPSGKVVKFSHRPLYAGKGRGKRIHAHLKQAKSNLGSSRKVRVLRKLLKLNLRPIIIQTNSMVDEAMAFAFEIDLIAGIGRSDLGLGPLANLTDGFDGQSGVKNSTEGRANKSKAQDKRWSQATVVDKFLHGSKTSDWWQNLSAIEKETFLNNKRGWTSRLPKEQYDELCAKHKILGKAQWNKLSAEEKATSIAALTNWMNKLSLKERSEHGARASRAAAESIRNMTRKDYSKLQKRRGASVSAAYASKSPEEMAIKAARRKATLAALPPVVCPHCGKVGKYPKQMQTYHFDNCSFR